MLAASSGFAVAVDGSEQTIDAKVWIALPGGVYSDVTLAVEALSISASATSALPGASRVASGTPAITAEITLSGLVDPTDETKTAAWLFGSWQTTSPLFRNSVLQCPVTIDLGVVPDGTGGASELLRKFTGYVDTKTVNSDGTVTLTCYDKRNTLRGTVNLPAVVTAPPFNAGMTSEFAVDWLLRQASGYAVSTWPKPRPSCVFAASMRSSLWPEVGGLAASSVPPRPTFAPGVMGTGLAALFAPTLSPLDNANVNYTLASPVSSYLSFEYWGAGDLNRPWTIAFRPTSSSDGTTFMFSHARDGFRVYVIEVDGTVTQSDYASWPAVSGNVSHYYLVHLSWPLGSKSWTVTAQRDTLTATVSGTTATARTSNLWTNLTVQAPNLDPNGDPSFRILNTIEALQVTTEFAPVSNYGYTPTAILDPSLNALQYVPKADGDPWQTLQTIAEAELAVAGFDEAGMFRFRNRTNLRTAGIAKTLSLVKSLDQTESVASVINRARVEYAGATFGKAGIVWQLGDPVKVPRGGTVTITATTETPVGALSLTPIVLPNNATEGAVSRFRASADQYGVNAFTSPGNLTWRLAQVASDQVAIVVGNPTGSDAWLVSPSSYTDVDAGTPFLHLNGSALTVNDAATADVQWPPVKADGSGGAVSSRWSELLTTITGNPWIQDAASAARLAGDIVQDQPLPRPDMTNLDAVPDVRLQLMDKVTVVESDRHGITGEPAILFGWDLRLGHSEYSMTFDARTVGAPGGWLLGMTGRSELGVTTYT